MDVMVFVGFLFGMFCGGLTVALIDHGSRFIPLKEER